MTDLHFTYLYGISEEESEKLADGTSKPDSGGFRSKGAQTLQVKPSQLTVDELLSAVADKMNEAKEFERNRGELALQKLGEENKTQLTDFDNRITSAFIEAFSLIQEGFQATVARLDDISAQLQRIEESAVQSILKEAEECLGWMESDCGRIMLPTFSCANSDVSSHLSSDSAFLNRLLRGVENDQKSYDLYSFLIMQLIEPFTNAVFLYSLRYYRDSMKTMLPEGLGRWLETIEKISKSRMVFSGYEYYLRLNDTRSYLGKMYALADAQWKLANANGHAQYLNIARTKLLTAQSTQPIISSDFLNDSLLGE